MCTYRCIGIMSGTSLDGLDLCCVDFVGDLATDAWTYRVVSAATARYQAPWTERLRAAASLDGRGLAQLHVDYGHLIGQHVRAFIDVSGLDNINLVASHGHTVFHQPQNRLTFQIGDGEAIATYVRCPVVNNFRSRDVALRGQGAPLVPFAEAYLFSRYHICLNLGGIANVNVIGFGPNNACLGYDICPCNMLLNELAARLRLGKDGEPAPEYDDGGRAAASGQVIDEVLQRLDALDFYRKDPPKSLGREWFEENVLPIINTKEYTVADLLRTSVEHIARQIGRAVCRTLKPIWESRRSRSEPTPDSLELLASGGGYYNDFLLQSVHRAISDELTTSIGISSVNLDTTASVFTIKYKEAVIFAFLGLRCLLGLVNVDRTVTGADRDSVSGAIHVGGLQPEADSVSRGLIFDQMCASLRETMDVYRNGPRTDRRESSLVAFPFTASPSTPTADQQRAPPVYRQTSTMMVDYDPDAVVALAAANAVPAVPVIAPSNDIARPPSDQNGNDPPVEWSFITKPARSNSTSS